MHLCSSILGAVYEAETLIEELEELSMQSQKRHVCPVITWWVCCPIMILKFKDTAFSTLLSHTLLLVFFERIYHLKHKSKANRGILTLAPLRKVSRL